MHAPTTTPHSTRSKHTCRIVITTNPFHQLRSLLTFRCAAKQLDIPCADILLAYVPPQGSQAVASVMERAMLLGALVREVAALVWYWLRGRLC